MKRPSVQIKLCQPLGPKTIYTTGDTITGHVLFTPDEPTRVDYLALDFQGSMRISVENMVSHVSVPVNTVKRRFLRMELPVNECIPQVELHPDTEYTIPFVFVVPEQLPIQVCHHKCSNIQLRQEHLSLPPSLGQNGLLEGSGDMTPEEVHIFYEVKFTIWKTNGTKGRQKKTGDYNSPVYIFPNGPELAPILIPPQSRYYQPAVQKALNKGILRSTIGSLVASVFQPPAIKLSATPHVQTGTDPTRLRINIAFEPAHADDLPPRSVSTQLKLKAMTFYGVEPWEEFPDQTHPIGWDSRVAYWVEKLPLSLNTPNRMTVNWIRHPQSGATDRRTVYTASVDLVGSLPTGHVYPPTFHSCFVSRVYALSALLKFQSHDKAQRSSNLTVTTPIQIIA